MLARYHEVRAKELSSLVHTRKTYNTTRHEQVSEILYDNFHRKYGVGAGVVISFEMGIPCHVMSCHVVPYDVVISFVFMMMFQCQ